MHGDISSQICEVMKVKITQKRIKGRPRKLWEEYVKIWNNMARKEMMHAIERNIERELDQQLLTLFSRDNIIKTDVVVVFFMIYITTITLFTFYISIIIILTIRIIIWEPTLDGHILNSFNLFQHNQNSSLFS